MVNRNSKKLIASTHHKGNRDGRRGICEMTGGVSILEVGLAREVSRAEPVASTARADGQRHRRRSRELLDIRFSIIMLIFRWLVWRKCQIYKRRNALDKHNAGYHLNHASRCIISRPTVLQIKKSELKKQAIHQIKRTVRKANDADGCYDDLKYVSWFHKACDDA